MVALFRNYPVRNTPAGQFPINALAGEVSSITQMSRHPTNQELATDRGKFGCARRTQVLECSLMEARDKQVGGGESLLVTIVIATFVFPVFVLAFHLLVIVPTFFVSSLLVHFGGSPRLWAKTLSIVAFLPACWGAVAVCKSIWPRSK
jgi:hypothetical protein